MFLEILFTDATENNIIPSLFLSWTWIQKILDPIHQMLYIYIMNKLNDDGYCFACGTQNPRGLKLNFYYDTDKDEMVADYKFDRHFQGWEGVLHGGLISTVLDEIMAKAAAEKGLKCVTAELSVRFIKPAMLNKQFTIRGRINQVKKRLILAEGSITDSDNIPIATARGKFITID